ncbi:hypothetical protein B0O80DRAFT_525044 [Mortierella sp. GBAus27b]|nr:hypothetical protein B0O80DRAFT_525044 [Mortierella sp. GBAus27b]
MFDYAVIERLGQLTHIPVIDMATIQLDSIEQQLNLQPIHPRKFSLKQLQTTTTMPLFKSNKNKSASAASTPAQTPRSSMQETRPKTTAMTPEEALQKVMDKSMYGLGGGLNLL